MKKIICFILDKIIHEEDVRLWYNKKGELMVECATEWKKFFFFPLWKWSTGGKTKIDTEISFGRNYIRPKFQVINCNQKYNTGTVQINFLGACIYSIWCQKDIDE